MAGISSDEFHALMWQAKSVEAQLQSFWERSMRLWLRGLGMPGLGVGWWGRVRFSLSVSFASMELFRFIFPFLLRLQL